MDHIFFDARAYILGLRQLRKLLQLRNSPEEYASNASLFGAARKLSAARRLHLFRAGDYHHMHEYHYIKNAANRNGNRVFNHYGYTPYGRNISSTTKITFDKAILRRVYGIQGIVTIL